MQVLIREGSVSKDLAALAPLINEFASPFLGFCTDDRNPLDIHEEGHLDYLVRRAIALGAPLAAVYRTASWSAARGFGLVDRGLIAPGFLADFLLLDDLESCAIHSVFRRGRRVTPDTFAGREQPAPPGGNTMNLQPVTAEAFRTPASGPATPVIGIIPGKILTERIEANLPYREGMRHADPEHDLLKICVLERHGRTAISAAVSSRALAFARARWPPRSAMTATTSAWWAPGTRIWRWPSTACWRWAEDSWPCRAAGYWPSSPCPSPAS